MLAFNVPWLMEVKDLPRRTASDKLLLDNAFNTAKNPKYDGYQRGLTNFLIKCLQVGLLKVRFCQTKNYQKNYKKQLHENLKNKNYTHFS